MEFLIVAAVVSWLLVLGGTVQAPSRRWVAIGTAAAGVPAAALLALLALIEKWLQCDDSCSTIGGWHSTAGAWQWDAQFWIAFVALLACVATLVLLVARRERLAIVAGALTAISTVGWIIFVT